MNTSHMYKTNKLQTNKSSLLQSYVHTVNIDIYSLQYPLCLVHTHDTNQLFNYKKIPIQYHTNSLYKKLLKAAEFIRE